MTSLLYHKHDESVYMIHYSKALAKKSKIFGQANNIELFYNKCLTVRPRHKTLNTIWQAGISPRCIFKIF